MSRLIPLLILTLVLLTLFSCVGIVVDGLTNTSKKATLGIVLGSRVHPDGRPSVALKKRLEHALTLFQNSQIQQILVSGGQGKEGHDEARVMEMFLLQSGVPRQVIHVDSLGTNTRLTARHAKELMDREGFDSAIVISNYYHVSRARLACRQEGIPSVSASAPIYFHPQNLWSIPRDALAWWFYKFHWK